MTTERLLLALLLGGVGVGVVVEHLAVRALLLQLGLEARSVVLLVPGGGHNPRTWRRVLPSALLWMSQHLQPEPGAG